MKLIEIAHRTMGENAPRTAYRADAAPSGTQPPDAERDSLRNAIKAASVYAVIVVQVADVGGPIGSLVALADFVRGLNLPDSFAGYCIIGPAAAGSNSDVLICRILFKAIGSYTAASIKRAAAHTTPRSSHFMMTG